MEMGVDGKDTKTCLGILDSPGNKSNIGHHILKVMNDKIVTIIQDIRHKEINQNKEDEVLLMLNHGVCLCKKSKGDKRRQLKYTLKEYIMFMNTSYHKAKELKYGLHLQILLE